MQAHTQRGPDPGTDFTVRIAALHRLEPGALACELASLRSVAVRNGLKPAVTVIHALNAALARGERGTLVHDWLAILREAVECGRSDPRTCDTYAAVCSVRLGC